jgi:NAD(P)-dependent dehydrogenase (short-subunit alcohol dehydrogenase family)
LADLDNLVAQAKKAYGRVDVLYGNAGVGNFFAIEDMDVEHDFTRTVNLFCRANWYLAKLLLPGMIEQKKGDFIFTTSTAAYNGVGRGSVYSGSKAMLHSLMRAIAMGYGKYNIRANCVVPGLTTTELSPAGGAMEKKQLPYVPMGRPGTAEEVAYAALFLASDECRYCTATEIIINGGSDHMGTYFPDAKPSNNDDYLTGELAEG